VCEHDSDVAVTDLRPVQERAVARPESDPLRIDTLRVLAAPLSQRGRRLLWDALLRAAAAAASSTRNTTPQARIYIRSGASTPTRFRLSAITICVARMSASRNSCASLSSTRCSW